MCVTFTSIYPRGDVAGMSVQKTSPINVVIKKESKNCRNFCVFVHASMTSVTGTMYDNSAYEYNTTCASVLCDERKTLSALFGYVP